MLCVPCDRCGEHLLVTEATHVIGLDEDQARRRLRAALELGTRKLRCNRCSGMAIPLPEDHGPQDDDRPTYAVVGPFRPIDYRLGGRP